MHRPRRRCRRALVATTLAATLGLAAACTSGGGPAGSPSPSSSAPSPSSTTPSPTGGPVTLRFGVYGDASRVAAYRRMALAFHRRHPLVTVRVTSVPDAAQAESRLRREFTLGTAPDLFVADSTTVPSLVAGGRVQPVDTLLEDRGVEFGDEYERLGLEAFAENSSLQCMPSDVSPYVVFYNKRLVDLTAGIQPPDNLLPTPDVNGWSWAQFSAIARAASRGGVKGAYLSPTLTSLTPLLRSAGGDVVDDPQKPTTLTLSTAASRPAMDTILQLVRDGAVTPTATELLRTDPVWRFRSGRLAMMVGTRALVPQLRAAKGLDFDVYPLPNLGRSRTIADVSGYCLSRTSTHVEAAADFLAFASGARGSALAASSGAVVPARLATLRSRTFLEPGRLPFNVTVFTSVIRRADTMPNPPAWPLVQARTQPLLSRLFYGRVPDIGALLTRIDQVSAQTLAQSTASPSPSGSATGSPSGSDSSSASPTG